ncbi:hypothetical protein D3C81_358560 [compost metagenome]
MKSEVRPDAAEILRVTFNHQVERNVSREQLQDFIDRSRNYHADNQELLIVLDELEKQIPEGE